MCSARNGVGWQSFWDFLPHVLWVNRGGPCCCVWSWSYLWFLVKWFFDVKSLKITAIVCFHTVTFSCVLPQRFYSKSSKDRWKSFHDVKSVYCVVTTQVTGKVKNSLLTGSHHNLMLPSVCGKKKCQWHHTNVWM